jgi:hypothetical protein
MCVDTCAAFTGPFADLDECPICFKPRYNQDELRRSNGKIKVPQKVFTTFPLGPQLQSRWRSPGIAQDMHYRREKTRELLHKRDQELYDFDDIFCGSDYLEAVEEGKIKDEDTVVMFSIDGAQLYRNKKSDCWIYIWIILDLAPDQRYKIRSIVPGGVIPGPKNPKHLDSFLFPGLAHVSAVQKKGMMVWDGYRRVKTPSNIILWLILADTIAMTEVSGSVGHHGRKGCRLLCGFIGRNKPAGSHYYPALLRPLDYEDYEDKLAKKKASKKKTSKNGTSKNKTSKNLQERKLTIIRTNPSTTFLTLIQPRIEGISIASSLLRRTRSTKGADLTPGSERPASLTAFFGF